MRLSTYQSYEEHRGLVDFVNTYLTPMVSRYSGLTHADLHILAGVLGLENNGGPAAAFCGGRVDLGDSEAPPEGFFFFLFALFRLFLGYKK